ncbi:MAG TPA: beta-ketoacyl-ACP synthase III [Candidatus Angelobacter sp.]|nr:beta-ketoacyl-ACP synthase III [Candidatus Angelobacter sp.]
MANLVRAKISALGTYVPPKLLTNSDLEKMVETSNDWILERTGIRQRHIVEKGVPTSHLATEAASRALAERGISGTDIEAIFLGTVTPDMLFPATACLVQDRIGAKGAWGYDISAACSGFVYALQTGVKFVESGAHKRVLVIGADVMSSIIDYTDRATCVIFGDGAGAVVIEPATDDNYCIDFLHEVDGSGGCYLKMPGGGSLNPATCETVKQKMHYVHQDGQQVFKYAVRKMAEASVNVLERNGYTGDDVALFVPHQANKRIIMSAADRLGLREDRVIINIDEFGNTTAGTIPLALESARQQGRLKKGDLVLIASVGAGFTVGAALLRWAC